MSVGRSHMLVLDEDNLMWEMRAWGVVRHVIPYDNRVLPLGNLASPLSDIRQYYASRLEFRIEC